MRRITEQEKERIKDYVKSGVSKHKISNIMGISRATVIRYSGSKGKYNKPIKEFNVEYSRTAGEVVGIFTGDGSQYYEPKAGHYEITIHIGKNNIKYLEYTKDLLEKHFDKNFWISQDKKCFKLRTHSKALFKYFETYLDYNSRTKHSTVALKTLNLPKEFLLGFLKGFLDTDGCIYNSSDRKILKISYCTTSQILANQLKEIINNLSLKCGIYCSDRFHRNEKDLYSILIWKESTDRFLNMVKPFKLNRLRGW